MRKVFAALVLAILFAGAGFAADYANHADYPDWNIIANHADYPDWDIKFMANHADYPDWDTKSFKSLANHADYPDWKLKA
ncbi:hypothetical protein [Thalassobacillus hwangdonensis]|uniref:Uncharacterized protein n=1 Tax=Thalassobacillus hwangdonensis TaxID=546108 RepID=A0ABW3L1N9_9BACI